MRRGAALVLVATVALASCEVAERRADPPLPAGPQVLQVEMDEYAFRYEPPLDGGRVLVRVRNTGRVVHTLTVLPLAEDVPPIEQQLQGGERRGLAPFAGVGVVKPGARTTFAVDLSPGRRYGFICFVTDAGGQSHALRGMASEFRAGGRRPPERVPPERVPPERVPPAPTGPGVPRS